MTAYDPQPFVKVNGVTWTAETLEGITITVGRTNVNEQARASYAQVTIVTPDDANYPNIDIDQIIEIGVLDTSAAEKILYTGQVSDIQVSLASFGESGFLVQTAITAVGKLAQVNRRGVGVSGYPQELDGVRVEKILSDALGLTYVLYGDYYGQGTDPTRINLILNPSIEVNTNGWERSNANIAIPTRVTTDSFIGIASLNMTTTNAGNAAGSNIRTTANATYRVACVPGDTFRFSCYVKNTVGTRNLAVQLEWFVNATTTTVISRTLGSDAVNPTGWTRVSVTGTAPATTTHMGVSIRFRSNGAIGDTALIDGALLETGSTLGSYFDGDSINSGWNGTANDSTSTNTNPGTYFLAGTQTWQTLDPFLSTFDSGDYQIATYAGGVTNAYTLATTTAQSAGGVIYETADNRVGYKDADSRVETTSFIELPADVILASGIQATERLADLANDVTVSYGSGLTVQDDNPASIDVYGRLAASVSTNLADLPSANALLTYYLDTKSLPRRQIEQLTLALHLDSMENTLRDDLLDVTTGTGIETSALPAAIFDSYFTGFVEGWTWTITRKALFLQLRVSEYLMSVIAEQWAQVDPAEAWNTINATLEWQKARVVT